VIHPGAVGDVLVAVPALLHLRTLLPGVHRTLAAGPRPAALLAGSPGAEATVDLDRLELHRLFVAERDPALGGPLAAFDVIVSWLGAGDPRYAAHLAQPGRRVVVARAVPPPGRRRHASWHLVETLAPLGPPPAVLPLGLLVPTTAEGAWARAWLAARGLGPGDAVVLHPGAGSAAKAWPGFPDLARGLVAAGLPVVVTTGPADPAVTRWLESDPASRCHVAADLSLRQLAALTAAARAYVGNDSGPTHLAAATGCDTVALFGPTDPAVWAPLGPRVTVLTGAGPGTADPWAGLDPPRVVAAVAGVDRAAAAMA
jgi:ADP-heptose:LPS heptosyltransferase